MKLRNILAGALAFALSVSCALAQTNQGSSPTTIAKGGTNATTAAAARTNLGLAIGSATEAWDADLDCLAANSTVGVLARTGAGTCASRTLTAPAAGFTITNPAGTAGDPTFVLANDLAALEALSSTGFAVRTGTDAWAQRTFTAPAAGFTITNPAGVAGNPTFVLANDLAALEGLSGTGIARRTGTDVWSVGTNVLIAEGGTGQATQQLALNALAPTPTRAGDLMYFDGTNWVSFAGNNSGTKTLQESSAGVLAWASLAAGSAGQLPGTATNDAATTGNVGELISVQAPYNAAGATITVTIASPAVVTWTAHGLVNTAVDGNVGVPVFFTTTGALPTGIVANTTYYAVSTGANTFNIATTIANAIAGTFINTTGSQSGVQTGFMGLRIGTSSTAVDVVGISLTAGDWDVGGLIQLQPISAATITLVESYVSTVSVTRAASPAGGTYFFDQQAKTAGTGMASFIGKRRISISGTTTVYFGAFTQFTGTALNITAYLGARRVR